MIPTNIPTETLRDWNCIDEKTQQPQSLTPLIERSLHDLALTLLSWVRGNNLNYPANPQALAFEQETGEGYVAFNFHLHGDVVAKRTLGSQTHHQAKVILFDGASTSMRVRYLIWRKLYRSLNLDNYTRNELLDMLEVDYSLNAQPGMNDVKKAATDMYNHFNGDMFDFSNYREHLAHEPRINGKQGFRQLPTKRLIQPDLRLDY